MSDMKKKLVILLIILVVATLCLAACDGSGDKELQTLNEYLKGSYSKITVVVSTKDAIAELNGNFTLTFNGTKVDVAYKFDKINSFDVDGNGNIADADGNFIQTIEGQALVRNGKIIDGDDSVELPLDQLSASGFSFQKEYFSNVTLKNAKFEADVTNPQQFTGNSSLTCSDMHVIVIRNTVAKAITSIELTYTSSNGAQVKINYLLTK